MLVIYLLDYAVSDITHLILLLKNHVRSYSVKKPVCAELGCKKTLYAQLR